MSELLKASLVQVDPSRSRDALQGVGSSPYQPLSDRATTGPYNSELQSAELKQYLSDPASVLVAGCGRNELRRGNLAPVLNYAVEATRNHQADSMGNVLYADGNSDDGSVEAARELGAASVSRKEILGNHIDRKSFADILGMPEDLLGWAFESKEGTNSEYPPLRKGADVLVARIEILKMALEGRLPKHVTYIDTDLKSIPGGAVADKLSHEQVYRPIELMGQAVRDLGQYHEEGSDPWAVFTGSENRNNEPIFAAFNMIGARAASGRLSERQREIARALSIFPGVLVHPLTGELTVKAEEELYAMNATGQAVEVARILSLAGRQYELYGTTDAEQLASAKPLVGNVRRGTQMRIDEPQIDDKEWWMILGVLPPFIAAVADYAIDTSKLPHEFTLDDYANLNQDLSRINNMPRLHNPSQTRVFDHFPMERAIPPVALLHKEGIIKV